MQIEFEPHNPEQHWLSMLQKDTPDTPQHTVWPFEFVPVQVD